MQVSFCLCIPVFIKTYHIEAKANRADDLNPMMDETIFCSHELIPEKDKDKEPSNLQLSPDVSEVRNRGRNA